MGLVHQGPRVHQAKTWLKPLSYMLEVGWILPTEASVLI